jgi:hypothetical protein
VNTRQYIPCKIRTSAARNDGGCGRPVRSGNQCGSRAGARSEVADRPFLKACVLRCPVGSGDDATAEQWDVEPILGGAHVDTLLGGREQVEEQRRETTPIQKVRYLAIARAETAAAASVREDDEPAGAGRNLKVGIEHIPAVRNSNRVDRRSTLHVHTPVG